MDAPYERVRAQLREACLSGDLRAAEALLRLEQAWHARLLGSCCVAQPAGSPHPNTEVVLAVLCAPFAGDRNNTLLHYLAAGAPLGAVGRLLWVASGGPHSQEVQPGRNDERRAQLAEWLLSQHPAVLRLLCARNAAGLTPLHSCLGSASAETLRALVRGTALLSPGTRRLLLAVPSPGGQSPLDVCLQDPRQWEAVQLLVAAGSHLLGHGFLAAAQQVALLLGSPLAAGGGLGSKGTGSGGLVQAVSGVLRSAIDSLLDRVAGQAPQREAVEQHLAARQAQRASAAGSSGANAAGPDGAAGTSAVAVLAGAAEVERLRQEQIDSVAGILGVSAPEAAALLAAHGYDEVRVMQARLGAEGGAAAGEAGSESGSGDGGAPGTHNSSRAKAVGLAAVLEPAGEGGDSAGSGSFSGSFSGRAGPGIIDVIAWQASGGSAPAAAVQQQPPQPPQQQCLVCYEACSSNSAMPCGHPTCDACWAGILRAQLDTGEVHRVVCPEPGCGMPLPLEEAARLLDAREHHRYRQLVAHSYVDANPTLRWCPRPGCGNVVRLLGRQGAAEAHPSLREAAAAGRGVGVECRCGHAFCWACGCDPHEPATCEQVRRWEAELEALRDAAPSQDRQWLDRNTKRCPACRAPIEKNGGCMHMTCRACRHQWCWACGRAWALHSQETGGYYHCILERRDDLPDFVQDQPSGPLGWLLDAWSSLQGMTAQRALQQHLREHLRHDHNPATLSALCTHVQRLLRAAGACCSPGCPGTRHASGTAAAAGSRPPRATQPGQGAESWQDAELGPATLLGLSLGEASRIGPAEWGQLVAAAAESLADSGQLGGGDAARQQAAGLARARAAAAEGSRCDGSAARAACTCVALVRLAGAVQAGHRALQYSAVAAWALGPGSYYSPRRRFLDRLCEGVGQRVARLEGLLLALPDREAALQCQRQFEQPGLWETSRRRVNSLAGRLLRSLWGVSPPQAHTTGSATLPASAAAAAGSQQLRHGGSSGAEEHVQERALLQERLGRGLVGEQLRQQLYFALALQHQQAALQREVAALEGAVEELLQAGRAGLFAG